MIENQERIDSTYQKIAELIERERGTLVLMLLEDLECLNTLRLPMEKLASKCKRNYNIITRNLLIKHIYLNSELLADAIVAKPDYAELRAINITTFSIVMSNEFGIGQNKCFTLLVEACQDQFLEIVPTGKLVKLVKPKQLSEEENEQFSANLIVARQRLIGEKGKVSDSKPPVMYISDEDSLKRILGKEQEVIKMPDEDDEELKLVDGKEVK